MTCIINEYYIMPQKNEVQHTALDKLSVINCSEVSGNKHGANLYVVSVTIYYFHVAT